MADLESDSGPEPGSVLEQFVREEWGRLVALLLSQFRRLDLVEDALGDAVEAAHRTWPVDGVPSAPPAWLLTASFSRTERPPSIQERFSDGAHPGTASFELGDPSLAPERSTGLEVSLRRRTGRVTGQLNAFAHNFDNFIYAAATGEVIDGLAAYQYQQQAARSWGGEAEVIWHLHEAEGRLFDLTIAADVVRARTRGRENLPRIAPPRLRGALDWQRGPLALGVEVQHVLAQEHTAPAETRTPAYTLASAYAGWRHHLGGSVIDVLLRGANLLDEEARMHTSWLKHYAPLPGRDLTLSVRLGF